MTETEAKGETWKWEVVEDPAERLRLIETTIAERVRQTLVVSIWFAENAASDMPDTKDSAKKASDLGSLVNQQLRAIQRVINSPTDQPLPIDRTTYANVGKVFIVLDHVPKPAPLNPLPKPQPR